MRRSSWNPFAPEPTTREKVAAAVAKGLAPVIDRAATAAGEVTERASTAVEQASDAVPAGIAERLPLPEDERNAEGDEALFSMLPTGASGLKKTGALAGLFALGYTGAPLWVWTATGAAALYGKDASKGAWVAYGALAALFNAKPLRRRLSAGLMQAMEELQFLPKISETEQTAIEAGTTWMDAELFSGRPNLAKLNSQPYPELSKEEQAFLDGSVEEVCDMIDDWDTYQRGDLSDEVWDYLKEEGFFGLIIPKAYGGKGFSATANSAVVQKLATRSLPLSITVMVPNSLGPAELLLHYGTEEQKKHYLPRLADGREIPAFALTEPTAGSDAGAMTSRGEVFEGDDGELCLRINWKKRYISLAAVATILGLAFKLRDPQNLLGRGEDLGITCALIPTDTEGVEINTRHDPMGVPFYNCPTEGEDIVVPVDAIIGGPEGAGQGWKMLMNSLSAGRGISLPAQATGGGKLITRIAGAHAAVREQFGLPIGKFEGIEEPLARIAGLTYLMEAARRYTTGAIDAGEEPSVVSAIMKYNTTEMQRQLANDGMDILAGNGISRGPRNLLAHGYQGLPISITVEGANILTRTLMIFGQGAIRCHPYVYDEVQALMERDVEAFDAAFWQHVGHVVRNGFRALGLSLTRGRLARAPVGGPAAPYWRRLAWASASFAFAADLALGALGGALKRKEKISGRFADILSWMYLAAATLRRFDAEGRPKAHEPYFRWAMEYAFGQMQEAFDALYENFEVPGLAGVFRCVVAPWSRLNTLGEGPPDALGHRVAQGIQDPDESGDRVWLTDGMYVPEDEGEPLAQLEEAFHLSLEAYDIGKKIKSAIRAGDLPKAPTADLDEQAAEKGIITEEERRAYERAGAARAAYLKVDAFDLDEYRRTAGSETPRPSETGDASGPSPEEAEAEPAGDGAAAEAEAIE